ncbi:DUF397 domain-containing protein [Streptomyces sp. NPDC001373]|uniref:DUF397 domain-containing protein n=1 Tax=Streptomyces sp. NPDC001373 TaxID=3364565 RepID=UPI003674972D
MIHPSELHWFKSSYSDSNESGDCVEVATTAGTVHVRDSKALGPQFAVSDAAWAGFVTSLAA